MSDNQQKDVLIAVYMFEDLAERDFDAVMKLAESKTITVEGVVVVEVALAGTPWAHPPGARRFRQSLARPSTGLLCNHNPPAAEDLSNSAEDLSNTCIAS